METTQRLSMPMLLAGQAQKEVFHNEALHILDAMVCGAVEEGPRNDPPASPSPGTAYIVGAAPMAEWSLFAHHVAAFTAAGWRYIAPTPGLILFIKATATFATYGTAGWEVGAIRGERLIIGGSQVVGPQSAAIAAPAGGTIVDSELRATMEQVLMALRSHGLIAAS
jgi:hypothetical protein